MQLAETPARRADTPDEAVSAPATMREDAMQCGKLVGEWLRKPAAVAEVVVVEEAVAVAEVVSDPPAKRARTTNAAEKPTKIWDINAPGMMPSSETLTTIPAKRVKGYVRLPSGRK